MVRCFHVDAFSARLLAGNPAAVMPLDAFPSDATMAAIAGEHNLSETAFVVEGAVLDDSHDADYALRWFTPKVEVDLCGHATLATALVVFLRFRPAATSIRFSTHSGVLVVERLPAIANANGDKTSAPSLRLRLLAPALFYDATEVNAPEHVPLRDALGVAPVLEIWRGRDALVLLESVAAVADAAPDLPALAALAYDGAIVTARVAAGDDVPGDIDFVSRYFVPRCGIDEDPVTGYAHCLLAPFWGQRLGSDVVVGRQISSRPGEVHCSLIRDDTGAVTNVWLEGDATMYAESEVHLPLSTLKR